MKFFNVQLTTLKSKLYAIVFASFVVRVVAFFVLPNTASNLAPDEGQYAYLVDWVSQGKPVSEYPLFGPGLYHSMQAIVWPSVFFKHLGVNSLDSIRLTSSIYSLLAVVLVAQSLIFTFNSNNKSKEFIQKNPVVFFGLFATFVFIPSHFLWSILGLRESATEFWTLSTFLTLFLLFHCKNEKQTTRVVYFLLSIIMLYNSRPQVGLVASSVLLIYLLFHFRVKLARILVLVTLLGTMIGSLLINTENAENAKHTPVTINLFESLFNQAKDLNYHREANQEGAASVIKTTSCPYIGEAIEIQYFCFVWQLPYTTTTFIFRPLLRDDVTSNSARLAVAENLLWLSAFIFIFLCFFRNKRLAFLNIISPSVLFLAVYCVAAGAYEGNMGTAFRHKSLILWVVLLLLASTIVATQQRKAEREGISNRS
jgi:hypothetical protein